MGSIKVFIYLADGNVEIEIFVSMQDPYEEVDEENIRRILVSHQLDIHGPELNPPACLIVNRDFESDGVPVAPIC